MVYLCARADHHKQKPVKFQLYQGLHEKFINNNKQAQRIPLKP